MFKKIIGWLLVIFFLGGVAGVLGSQLFLPWLAGFSPFSKIDWIARAKDGTTIINKTERITVEQSTAFQEVISQIMNSVVAVKSVNKKSGAINYGSGFILTSDGLIVTAATLALESAKQILVFINDKEYPAEIIKRGDDGLALLRIKEVNLTMVSLGDVGNLKLGEEVFLAGVDLSSGRLVEFVNRGFIKTTDPNLSVNFDATQSANGSPLVNFKGEVSGAVLVEKSSEMSIVGTDRIKELMK